MVILFKIFIEVREILVLDVDDLIDYYICCVVLVEIVVDGNEFVVVSVYFFWWDKGF